eukprot:TRINITY_DN24111_c0_g1_i1.p3 TRINITY_DN24111_c0_g1~~TRINITY_DN24111_c0_g1_i1.p3  ORF type:complete len:203 (+),score=18.22 TRINITY_DN24111_c0_g1_i1:185-793(+)
MQFVRGIPHVYQQEDLRPRTANGNFCSSKNDEKETKQRTTKSSYKFYGEEETKKQKENCQTILSGYPDWVKNDRKVLRYYAYVKDEIPGSLTESWRVRQVVLLFYLEDGTLQIEEPKIDNSGLTQGTFLRRHRVVKEDQSYVYWTDLKVGGQTSIYNRVYYITGCDDWTRNFLEKRGLRVPPNSSPPQDPYAKAQAVRIRRI